MNSYDDRAVPLLMKMADKRGAYDWNYSDVVPVIANLLADGDQFLAELATLRTENERLRGALELIANRHIPDQPAAYGGDECEWATRQHTELRRIAKEALK